MCFITWLVELLFIKLGWLKDSEAGDGCGLTRNLNEPKGRTGQLTGGQYTDLHHFL